MDAIPEPAPRRTGTTAGSGARGRVSLAFDLLSRGLSAWRSAPDAALGLEVDPQPPPPVRLAAAPRKPVFASRMDLVREVDGVSYVCLGGLDVRIDDAARAGGPLAGGRASRAPARQLAAMEYLEALDQADFERILGRALARREHVAGGNESADVGAAAERESLRACAEVWRDAAPDRAVVWMQELARRGSKVPRALREAAAAVILGELRALARSLPDEPPHAECLTLARAFLWAATFFEGDEPREWRILGAAFLTRALATTGPAEAPPWVEPSELPRVAGDLLECLATLDACPLADRTFRSLCTHAQRLADLVHADGGAATFGRFDDRPRRGAREVLDAVGRCRGRAIAARRRLQRGCEGLFVVRQGSALVVHRARAAPEEDARLPLDLEWSVFGQRIVLGGRHQLGTGRGSRLAGACRHAWRRLLRLVRAAPVARIEKTCALGEGFHVRTLTALAPDSDAVLDRRVDLRTSEIAVEERSIAGPGGRLSIDLHPAVTVRRRDARCVVLERGNARIEVASTRSIAVAPARVCTEPFLELESTRLEIEVDPREPASWIRFLVLRPESSFSAAS